MGNLRLSSNSSDVLEGRGGPDLRRLWAMATQVEPGHSSCGDSQVGPYTEQALPRALRTCLPSSSPQACLWYCGARPHATWCILQPEQLLSALRDHNLSLTSMTNVTEQTH